jgi:hypothetical protein
MLDSTKPYCGLGNIQNLDKFMRELFMDNLVIENEMLPFEFHDNRSGERTLARLNELCDKRDGLTEHVKLKALKARNIEKLAAQVEAKTIRNAHGDFVDLDGELDYSDNEIDDPALTRNMMALVGGMVNGGLLDSEDFEEC